MMPNCCKCTLEFIKSALLCINALIWITGLTLLIMGALWLEVERRYDNAAQDQHVFVGVFLIAFGMLLTSVSILGFYGTIRENIFLSEIEKGFLILIIVLHLDFSTVAFTLSNTVEEYAEKFIDELYEMFKKPKNKSEQFINYIQAEFHCCGILGYDDYQKYRGPLLGSKYPETCCKEKKPCIKPFLKGCGEAFEDYLRIRFAMSAILLLLSVFLAVAGTIFIELLKKRKPKYVVESLTEVQADSLVDEDLSIDASIAGNMGTKEKLESDINPTPNRVRKVKISQEKKSKNVMDTDRHLKNDSDSTVDHTNSSIRTNDTDVNIDAGIEIDNELRRPTYIHTDVNINIDSEVLLTKTMSLNPRTKNCSYNIPHQHFHPEAMAPPPSQGVVLSRDSADCYEIS